MLHTQEDFDFVKGKLQAGQQRGLMPIPTWNKVNMRVIRG